MAASSWALLLALGTLILVSITTVSGLECYACENQESNKDKCIKTTKQCEEHQDICMTSVRWGLPPYWVPYGDRSHFISKNCETQRTCEQKKKDMMPSCKRDWFDDWGCIDCCSGDLCNHYVTLGAGSVRASVVGLCAAALSAYLLRHLL